MKNRWVTATDLLTAIAALVLGGITFALLSGLFGAHKGYPAVMTAVMVSVTVLMVQRTFKYRKVYAEQCTLKADLEMKDILYNLLQKTSVKHTPEEFYEEILQAAINAMPGGDKGSIIDIRQRDRVRYVAVQGFNQDVLEQMNLGYRDTYLYKETGGTMDETVIIRNSVNYNQLHANDGLVESLIRAGTAGIRSTICTPIVVDGETIGMVNIDSSEKNAFGEGDIAIIEIFAMEVGKMIQYYEALQENIYLSQYDAMTKIYNRGYFYELHRRHYSDGNGAPYLFISTDIDNLKSVNDTYGHAVGDRLIKRYVKGIKSILDDHALFGRYGGDEFNILLPGTARAEAESMMTRAEAFFRDNPIEADGRMIHVTYSYGIAAWPEDEKDYEQLIILADQRMYEHKKSRKEQT